MIFQNWDTSENVTEKQKMKVEEKRKEYFALLNRKLELEKKAYQIENQYIQIFGELLEKVLNLKTECIKYKKTLAAYFKQKQEKGIINIDEIVSDVYASLIPYYTELEILQNKMKSTYDSISDETLEKIKQLYKEIVNMIHPDVSPELFQDSKIKELWGNANCYYKDNHYEELQETYYLIIERMVELGYDQNRKVDILDIDKKISKTMNEIMSITNSNPYLYKYLLDDKDETKSRQNELCKEIKEYKQYRDELFNEIKNLGIDVSKICEI